MVLEDRRLQGREGEAWEGVSENYLKVCVHGIPDGLASAGRLLRVRIEGHQNPCAGRYLAEKRKKRKRP